jgi:hypothetical protein
MGGDEARDVEEIEVPELPEGAEEPDEGMLDPEDRYVEGTTLEWVRRYWRES